MKLQLAPLSSINLYYYILIRPIRPIKAAFLLTTKFYEQHQKLLKISFLKFSLI